MTTKGVKPPRSTPQFRENVFLEKLFDYHGGMTEVFKKLEIDGSSQRIVNWRNRGRIDMPALRKASKLFKVPMEILNTDYTEISGKSPSFKEEVVKAVFLSRDEKKLILGLPSITDKEIV